MPTHDTCFSDDLSTSQDVSDDDFSEEDAESDYQSCESYTSDADEERTPENQADKELEIFQLVNHKWERIKKSDVQDLVGDSITNKEWISESVLSQRIDVVVDVRERSLDAMAVLAETVGGIAREWWHGILSDQEKDGSANDTWELQTALVLITFGKGTWSDTAWWDSRSLKIPSQGMYHSSLTCSLFEGRIVFDWSLDRPSKDLAEVMKITLPYFREMNARIDALSKIQDVGDTPAYSDSASFGPINMGNLITCLDIAESVAKLVPVIGNMLEGACGILRKTLNAAEVARTARGECKALAEHTACITLAIINEIGSTSDKPAIPTSNIFDLCATIGEVERRITSLSTLHRVKYFTARGKINAEVKDLRVRVDNARIAFKIRSDISTAGLLSDLRMIQTRLESRVDDLWESQKTTHHMLRAILVEVRGPITKNACVEEVDSGGGK